MRCKWCREELHYEKYLGEDVLCDSDRWEGAAWARLCLEIPLSSSRPPYHELDEVSQAKLIISKYAELEADSDLDTGTDNPFANS